MSDSLYDELLERLLESELSELQVDLVDAAWAGQHALGTKTTEAMGREARSVPVARAPRAAKPTPQKQGRVYIKSIDVRGFRGIGNAAQLDLRPMNGLTLVVGPNGCGKSSFAEGLELLLTGENRRWKDKSNEWREGWKNMHCTHAPYVAASLTREGQAREVRLKRTWKPDDKKLAQFEASAAVDGTDTDQNSIVNEAALSTYRPFLSYAELSDWTDSQTKTFDAVASALGLGRIELVADHLKAERKRLSDIVRVEKAETKSLVKKLSALNEPHADAIVTSTRLRKDRLGGVKEAIEAAHVSEDVEYGGLRIALGIPLPDAALVENRVNTLRGALAAQRASETQVAANAATLAKSLRTAMRAYDELESDTCHVCGTPGVLGVDWREAAERRAGEFEDTSRRLAACRSELAAARLGLKSEISRHRLPTCPIGLEDRWQALVDSRKNWDELFELDVDEQIANAVRRAGAVIAAVESVQASARVEIEARRSVWAPVAAELHKWYANLPHYESAKRVYQDLDSAYVWLSGTIEELRTQRFEPIKKQATWFWDTLRSNSHVQLTDLVLTGKGSSRKVALSVEIDGQNGAALGVMSQGELHAMALSLFLPRACLPDTPFGFVVLDDPVQSMDAARVDGLARALEHTSESRQVVVFTHDDRLREAVYRLGIEANILRVRRGDRSQVEVGRCYDPISAHIDDARDVVRDKRIPVELQARAVPGLCRMALESAVNSALRSKKIQAGDSHEDANMLIERNHSLPSRAALLLCDKTDIPQFANELAKRFGKPLRETFFDVNKAAHEGIDYDRLVEMVDNSERLARKFEKIA